MNMLKEFIIELLIKFYPILYVYWSLFYQKFVIFHIFFQQVLKQFKLFLNSVNIINDKQS